MAGSFRPCTACHTICNAQQAGSWVRCLQHAGSVLEVSSVCVLEVSSAHLVLLREHALHVLHCHEDPLNICPTSVSSNMLTKLQRCLARITCCTGSAVCSTVRASPRSSMAARGTRHTQNPDPEWMAPPGNHRVSTRHASWRVHAGTLLKQAARTRQKCAHVLLATGSFPISSPWLCR